MFMQSERSLSGHEYKYRNHYGRWIMYITCTAVVRVVCSLYFGQDCLTETNFLYTKFVVFLLQDKLPTKTIGYILSCYLIHSCLGEEEDSNSPPRFYFFQAVICSDHGRLAWSIFQEGDMQRVDPTLVVKLGRRN